MAAYFPLKTGDTGTVAQFSLCAGGLVRTWTDIGPPKLWSVPDAAYLHSVLGTGNIARTAHERDRFREVGILSEDSNTLWIQSRFPTRNAEGTLEMRGTVMELQPARPPTESTYDDVHATLVQAIRHALDNDEYLLVERGGWDSSVEPFCLFTVIPSGNRHVSVIETSPDPDGSELWAPHIVGDGESVTLSAPVDAGTIEAAPLIMLEAIGTWRIAPWDLALTFGNRGRPGVNNA